MDFPTIFYRTPGIHSAGGLLTYDYVGVKDEDEAEHFADQGYFPSLEEALAANAPKLGQTASEEGPKSDRALLEEEAKRLDVSFNWKTSDEVLTDRINEKRAG